MTSVTWAQVLAWRMRRQHIEHPGGDSALQIARRLAGVQAQVASSAELAVAIRQAAPEPGAVERALLDERTLVKTWAVRGTLHLLPADEAASYLVLCGAVRNWEKPAWQRTFGGNTLTNYWPPSPQLPSGCWVRSTSTFSRPGRPRPTWCPPSGAKK